MLFSHKRLSNWLSHSFEISVEGCCPSMKAVKKTTNKNVCKKGQSKILQMTGVMFLRKTDAFLNTEEGKGIHTVNFRNLYRHLMKNVFHFTSAQGVHTPYELLVFCTSH